NKYNIAKRCNINGVACNIVQPVDAINKATARVTTSDARGLEAFLNEYPDLVDGACFYMAVTKPFRLPGA
ncbi:MAG: hypothetical protein ABIK92_03520, partial [Pseudomonadota bacterium]